MHCNLDPFHTDEEDSQNSFFQVIQKSSSSQRPSQQSWSSQLQEPFNQSYPSCCTIQPSQQSTGFLSERILNLQEPHRENQIQVPNTQILNGCILHEKSTKLVKECLLTQMDFNSGEQTIINPMIHISNQQPAGCQFKPEIKINLQVKEDPQNDPVPQKDLIMENSETSEERTEESEIENELVKNEHNTILEAKCIAWSEFKDIQTIEKYVIEGGIIIDLSEFKESDNLKIDSRSSTLSQLFNFSQIHKYRKFIAGWVDFRGEALRQPSEIVTVLTQNFSSFKQAINLSETLQEYQNYLDARHEQVQAICLNDRIKSSSFSTKEETCSQNPSFDAKCTINNDGIGQVMKQLDRVLKQFEKYHYSFRIIRKHAQGIDSPCIGMSNSYLELMGFDAKDNVLAALRNQSVEFLPFVDNGDQPSDITKEQIYAIMTPLREQQRYYNRKQGVKYIEMTIPHTNKTIKAKIQTRIFALNSSNSKVDTLQDEILGDFVEIKLYIPETYDTPQILRGKRKISELNQLSSKEYLESPCTSKSRQYAQLADNFKSKFYSSQSILPADEIFRKKWSVRQQFKI